jgi:hypothetical protein
MRGRNPFWLWLWVMVILFEIAMIPACIPGVEQAVPFILLDPISGGPGTSVTVSGDGFPPSTPVSVRLGPPSVGATPQSYGDAVTDAGGSFVLSFTMPSHWPDGTPIEWADLTVIVLNEDGSAKAMVPFGYVPSSSTALTPASTPAEAYQQVILSWHQEVGATGTCSDVVLYASGYAEISSCTETVPLERRLLSEDAVQRLHLWTQTYQSFQEEQIDGEGDRRVLTRMTFVGDGWREVSQTEVRMVHTLLEALVPR